MDFLFFNDPASTEIYTLSLHDALPISVLVGSVGSDFADYDAWLSRHGVDTRDVRWSELKHTARFVCTTDAVNNQIASDRKSTRLNSSHANISYAVFCLKKKKPRYSDII